MCFILASVLNTKMIAFMYVFFFDKAFGVCALFSVFMVVEELMEA